MSVGQVAGTRSQTSGPSEQTASGAEKGVEFDFTALFEDPLDDGRISTQSEVRKEVKYEVPTPEHSKANPENLVHIYLSNTDDVAQTFGDDLVIIYEESDFEDPEKEFAELIASGSVKKGRLETVQGQSALVMEPNTDADGSNAGALQFVVNDVSITLLGNDISGERLKEIAETIKF